MRLYTGTAWTAAYVSGAGVLLISNNLSDLASASTARTNLGLATVAASGAYADLTGKPTAVSTFTNDAGYLTSFTEADPTVPSHVKAITTTKISNWDAAFSWGNHASAGYLTGITSGQVTTALGFTPYNATNPAGYITTTGARSAISATGSLSYNSTTGVISFTDAVTSVTGKTGVVTLTNADVGLGNVENKSSATIRGELTSGNVTTALGFTPYNATNPSGYITSSASITGSAASITGFNNPATAPTANTIVYRTSLGDIAAREIILSSGLSGDTPTVLVSMYPTTNQMVRTTPAAVAAALTTSGGVLGAPLTFNNMNNSHTTYTDANSVVSFGFRYLQGGTNGPAISGASQYYGMTLGLGNDYGFDSFASQFYWPRTPLGGNPYPSVRFKESGTWGAWSKIYAGWADAPSGSTFAATGDFRAPIFYDSNNTGYYGDFASTSYLNAINTATGVSGPQFLCGMTNYGDQVNGSTWYGIGRSTIAGWTPGGMVQAAAYTGLRLRSAYSVIDLDGPLGGNTIQVSSGSSRFNGDVRAALFYDNDNTAFYYDGAGATNINLLAGNGKTILETGDGYLRINQGSSFGNGIWFGSSTLNGNGTLGLGSNGDSNLARVRIVGGSYNGSTVITLNGADGVGTAVDSWRSPVFYDSISTAFYVDPNSTSNIMRLTASGRSMVGSATISMSGLDANTYYPVTIPLPASRQVTLRIENALNSNAPPWSTHGGGFSCYFEWTSNGSGWGTIPISRRVTDWRESFTSVTIVGGIDQMTFSSQEVIWLRGGANYYFSADCDVNPTIRTTSYTEYGQTVAPRSTVFNDPWTMVAGRMSYGTFQASDRVTAASDIRAPIFYDSNNTGFYLDPNSTGTSLNVAGSIVAAGNVTAYSDIRIKANVEIIPSALDKLDLIRGVTYTRTDLDDKEQRYAGVIAQEIESVLPEAVRDLGDIKAVDYNATIGLLIQAVKELRDEVETLKGKSQ